MPLRSALPSSLVRCWMTARRSFVSSSGRPCWSAQWKIRPSVDSWVSLRSSTFDSRIGPNCVSVARIGTALLDPPERQELDRERGGRPVVAGVGGPRLDLRAGLARPGQAGQVALDVGQQHGHAGVRTAARRGPAASSSCRYRSRRRPGRAGSASRTGCAPGRTDRRRRRPRRCPAREPPPRSRSRRRSPGQRCSATARELSATSTRRSADSAGRPAPARATVTRCERPAGVDRLRDDRARPRARTRSSRSPCS